MGLKTVKISIDKLYWKYKEHHTGYYEKYFRHDGNPLLFKNSPICMFAQDYVEYGEGVLSKLDEHPFVKYEYEVYANEATVLNDSHKHNASKRLINIVKSIRKHGYCKGKYNHPRYLIRVKKGFVSPFGNDPDGYTLVARKHRASACIALGMGRIKIKISSTGN